MLRRRDCTNLPERGWGLLLLTNNAPGVGAEWTDSGSSHEDRQLKHRAKKITRPVPIPPELVRLLRNHLEKFGVTPDGRLFRGERGGPLSETVYGRVWQATRRQAQTELQAASALVRRPCDLRYSGVTLALNAGVPAPRSRAEPGIALKSC